MKTAKRGSTFQTASSASGQAAEVLSDTRRLVTERLGKYASGAEWPAQWTQLMPGKMLRTRWAARLAASGQLEVAPETIVHACAATEMAHTASLCHDDVIDGGFLRRQQPTLWRILGPSAAILMGDLLMCEAMELLGKVENGALVAPFVAKLREVCAAELEQDLQLRGQALEESACLRLARSKSGPFFAFTGYVCGGAQAGLRAALEEAGYQVGTLYQMADDLLDILGSATAGKTLGTDSKAQKFTLPQMIPGGVARTRAQIRTLRDAALEGIQAWPPMRSALSEFFRRDLQPLIAEFDPPLGEFMSAGE